jgi:hypothetical protein
MNGEGPARRRGGDRIGKSAGWSSAGMTILWLVIWVLNDAPFQHFCWNEWGISLIVCVAIDLLRFRASVQRSSAPSQEP